MKLTCTFQKLSTRFKIIFALLIYFLWNYSKPTRVVWRYTDEGEEVRVSVRTGRIIPVPDAAEETYDYKEKRYYEGNLNVNLSCIVTHLEICSFINE